MARAIDKQTMLDLIIDAKRNEPEDVRFSDWLAEYLAEHLSTLTQPNEWISVSDKLPEEKEYVLIAMHDVIEVARIEKGISEEERKKMKSGEIPDEEEFGYIPGQPVFTVKRSDSIKACDQWGNNQVPYIWYARSGPMEWFGQYVTHWMPLPKPPKGGIKK